MKTIQIEDPRQQHKVKHTLQDVIGLVLIATLAGADTLVDIEFFGECHAETLAKYLSFPNGMPPHDTIGRVLQLVDPTYLYELQTNWNQFFIKTNDSTINKIINIDGKTMRGNASKDQKANHILSAWSKANGVCFGQVTVNDKSNELLYVLSTGCQWRALPKDYPKWQNVYRYYAKWSKSTANITDRKGALEMYEQYPELKETIEAILTDGEYTGEKFQKEIQKLLNAEVQVAKRSELHQFQAIPKRWIVERSFA
ncbi:ISAs1 family transposase [Bacillus sp. 196mf]|uniref:ISAs1 family transposase n=1 Tax=Bacillus sp. 196mf TaxID=1761754 RepID=UPI0015E8BE81|nr:ISAs1 family transposase [Bacillus sp. 196mf]